MGAPLGPRVEPITVTDETGEYILFRGKHCSRADCGVALTSRNRHENKLLCRKHRPKRVGPSAGRPRQKRKKLDISEEKKVQNVLSCWLCDPTDRNANEQLKAAMIDFELRYRFIFFDLPTPPQAIPLEEPHFTNPEHRTTRQEYLSACDAHGV
jgi:hypothetical protein